MSKIAVYTGSFDPITLGHLNVIDRSRQMFDTLVVGIGVNVDKKSLFTPVSYTHLRAHETAS